MGINAFDRDYSNPTPAFPGMVKPDPATLGKTTTKISKSAKRRAGKKKVSDLQAKQQKKLRDGHAKFVKEAENEWIPQDYTPAPTSRS